MSATVKTTKKSLNRKYVEQDMMWFISMAAKAYERNRSPENEARLKAKIETFHDYINRFRISDWLRELCFDKPAHKYGFWWIIQSDDRGVLFFRFDESDRFEPIRRVVPARAQLQLVSY